MADKKITELTAATNHATSDLLLVVKDASGTPLRGEVLRLEAYLQT